MHLVVGIGLHVRRVARFATAVRTRRALGGARSSRMRAAGTPTSRDPEEGSNQSRSPRTELAHPRLRALRSSTWRRGRTERPTTRRTVVSHKRRRAGIFGTLRARTRWAMPSASHRFTDVSNTVRANRQRPTLSVLRHHGPWLNLQPTDKYRAACDLAEPAKIIAAMHHEHIRKGMRP